MHCNLKSPDVAPVVFIRQHFLAYFTVHIENLPYFYFRSIYPNDLEHAFMVRSSMGYFQRAAKNSRDEAPFFPHPVSSYRVTANCMASFPEDDAHKWLPRADTETMLLSTPAIAI